MASTFLNALDFWASNPFAISDPVQREKLRKQVLSGPAAAELSRRVRRGDLPQAKNLILAIGQAQACVPGARPSDVLKPSHLPASVLRDLPRSRSDYLRIAMAAGRCYASIRKIRGSSKAMATLRQEIWSACFGQSLLHTLELEQVIRDHDVLILGATGTGKEAVAQAFLDGTPGPASGKPAPQSALNAAALPDTLVESELFGHAKGAFTGATEARLGRLRVAAGGSFFLDEVGDLPATTQVKLLRVIETNEISPLGSDTTQVADVRYVAATHKDLAGMVERGEFRRDLYERLAGITLRIPPLCERPEDIEEIGESFVASYLLKETIAIDTTPIFKWLRSSEARNYHWPGNVRELQNAIRNLLLGLPPGLKKQERTGASKHEGLPPSVVNSKATLEFVEQWYVDRVLGDADNNLTQAAQRLGVDRSTLRRRLRRQKQK
jgi:DNA-binding NtrC family response regulator